MPRKIPKLPKVPKTLAPIRARTVDKAADALPAKMPAATPKVVPVKTIEIIPEKVPEPTPKPQRIPIMNNGKGFFDMDVGKAFAGFSFPTVDVESFLASQRKTLEAFTHANQLAVEGVQALAKRQIEIVTQAIEEASSAVKEMAQPGAVDEKLAKNVELAKGSYEKILAATRELSELVAKTNSDTFGVLNKRVTEGFEEIRDYAAKTKKAA